MSWTGADNAGGTGLASYDIYDSNDNGAYTLWQNDVATSSANYAGANGHTYRFYSIATDNVGNTEAAPGSPDTQTQVVLPVASLDFGDAPDPLGSTPGRYPTLLANNGPRHTVGSLFLGGSVNGEANGQPDIAAAADSSDDGVALASTILVGTSAAAIVNASAVGKLDAWIDFDRDGAFESGERIANGLTLSAGDNVVSFLVPSTASSGTSYARFRLSSAGGLESTGAAPDGEVEDYRLTIDPLGYNTAQVRTDPTNPDDRVLVVVGTSSSDKIAIERVGSQFRAKVGKKTLGTYPAADIDRILILGRQGNDSIEIKSGVNIAAELHGESGNDSIKGSVLADWIFGGIGKDSLDGRAGDDLILGGTDDDKLIGSSGRDVLIGGTGKDSFSGDYDDDLLIAGTTSYDDSPYALRRILAEWTSSRDYDMRVANLRAGIGPVLAGSGIRLTKGVTVFDDGSQDTLKGNLGRDWFFFRLGEDKLDDRQSYEETN